MNVADHPTAATGPPRPPAARRRRGRWRTAQALALVVVVVALGPGGGGAGPGRAVRAGAQQGSGDDRDDDRLVLEEQTAWTRSGEEFAARFRLPAGHGGAVVAARLYPAIDDAAAVDATARGEDLGRPLRQLPDVEAPPGSPTAVVRVPVGSTADGVELDPGVYPLVVEASIETGDALDPYITHVVVTGPGQLGRRPVAVVTRVDQPFRWTPEGRLELEGGADVLASRLDPLLVHPTVPHTLLATPGTVSALADTTAGNRALDGLRDLARQGQVVNGSFARLAAGTWTAARLDQPLVDQFAAGEAALAAAFGAAPTGSTWMVSPTDDLTLLRWLSARGVRTFLVPLAGGLGGRDASPPSVPFRIEGLDRTHVGLALESVTTRPAPTGGAGSAGEVGIATAYRLLARLAVPALAGGGHLGPGGDPRSDADRSSPAPAVLLIDDLGPDARPVVEALLAGLDQAGPLRPVTVDGLGAGVDAGTDRDRPRWEQPEPARPDLGALPAQLAEAKRQLDSFVATAGPLDPVVPGLQRAVLALGADNRPPAERAATLAALDEVVRAQLGTVALDRDQPVTVTAHRADLPLAIHNRGTRPLDVALRVESSDLEVLGPALRLLRLAPGATTDVAVPVRVNRAGDFRVTVQISSPDGRLILAERMLTVRSTAISGVGVVLSVGALGFLFLWWGRHVRRTRRARIPVVAPTSPESPRVAEPVP